MEILRTLRFRLTFWNTAVVLLMVVATLVAVREGLRFSLLRDTDELLVEDAEEVRLTVEQLTPDVEQIQRELDRMAQSHAHRGLFVQAFDRYGRLLWSSVNSPAEAASQPIALDRRDPATVQNDRVVLMNLERPRLPFAAVRVGCSLSIMQAELREITRLILTVGAIAIVLSPLGGYWLAGRATRPLAKIIDTTRRLQPNKLDERLAVSGSRDELDQLAVTINGFLNRIATYIDQNREFTANAAHELRSPLAAIRSAIEVTLNSSRGTGEYQELLEDLLDECSQLTRLTNQLLLLSESDAGRLELTGEPFRLDHVVERAVAMFQGVAEAAEIELQATIDQPVWMRGDAGRLRQVINNLVDNAIKYNRPRGWVRVELKQDAARRTATLRVSDHGIGIAPADLPLIFERFYRGDESRHRGEPGVTAGAGLGLSICHSVVSAHGGTITVQSSLAGDTVFCVLLPTQSDAAAPPVDRGVREVGVGA
jgi:heavy metal sensor kinase